MKLPQELRYTESHEWVRRETDGTVSVGITDHAQEQLGDIVFVEAPQAGRKVASCQPNRKTNKRNPEINQGLPPFCPAIVRTFGLRGAGQVPETAVSVSISLHPPSQPHVPAH